MTKYVCMGITAKGMISSWITGRKKMEFITITISEQCITSKQAIMHLVVVIVNKQTFREDLA